ncbi:b(0,+)-type amino acid transporter 1-like isoform X1 [Polypterus senegalus]|uniref:b(0,+)-type amino acid transporter 1-like isoform X1 n=1 Tax=Polypterus senegalus TaxID=55291 RepID=UPI001965C098|nr:b(0,+)-type amino acid transporter 1-like isoform X1 [Polypterus senegalus]
MMQAEKDNILKDKGTGGIYFRKAVGYWEGFSFIVGIVIGSGIFIAPTGVIRFSHLNVGVALCIWGVCGLLSLMAALCYAELGVSLPSSGGSYYYNKRALGSIPAFIYMCVIVFFQRPASCSAKALTLSEYTLQPFYGECEVPEVAKKSLAVVVLLFLTIINCFNTKWAVLVQKVFTFLKILSLNVIIFGGISQLYNVKTSSLANGFSGKIASASDLAQAIYQGMWAYSGWSAVNTIAEELKNPRKNIPRCISTALPVVTLLYVLVNVSYLTVMTPKEMTMSAAVGNTWASRVLGSFFWIIPMSVAISTFGSINGSTFLQGRLKYAASREGHLPSFFSMLHIHHLTPAPGIILSGLLSILFVISSSLLTLTSYFGFFSWVVITMTCISLLVLRYREPDLPRPYKVPLPIVLLTIGAGIFFILAPIIRSPKKQYIYGLLAMFGSLIFYVPFVHFKLRFKFFDKVTYIMQLLCEVSFIDESKAFKEK